QALPSLAWILHSTHLVAPAALLVNIMIMRLRARDDRERFRRIFENFFLGSAAVFAVLELAGRPVLQVQYAASFLIPATALAFGLQIAAFVRTFNLREYRCLVLIS